MSGSTVVILVGCLIAFGAAYTVAVDGFDRVTTAQDEQSDRLLDRQNTAVELETATFDGGTLTVSIHNAGSTTLAVDRTDLLVDGAYVTDPATDVDGDGETELWLSGETLTFSATEPDDPERVKVVTQYGVSVTTTVGEEGGS